LTLPPLETILKLLQTGFPQGLRAPDLDPRRLGYFVAIWIGLEILADFAGLALKSPSVRAGLAQRFGKTGDTRVTAGDPSVIDLSPREYRHIDQPKRPARRSRKGSVG
jgi:hypothetical protein